MSDISTERLIVYGNNGSPYSCKMRSYLRFKRIPFIWVAGRPDPNCDQRFKKLRPQTIPVLEFPDGSVMNESTTLIKKIEKMDMK